MRTADPLSEDLVDRLNRSGPGHFRAEGNGAIQKGVLLCRSLESRRRAEV
jgi:hypothetical protein